MDFTAINGKRLAVWLTDDSGESAVFAGKVHWDGVLLTLDRGDSPQFEIRAEWYERIKPVDTEETRRILLDSDYYVRLIVGNLADSDTESDYERTGLKWPN